MLILCALCWSGNFIVGKLATLYEVPPLTLNFFRWLIVWLILFPFTIKDILANKKLVKKNFGSLLIMSLTSISIFNSVVYYSLNFTQVLTGVLMISTIPVLIIFISYLFRVENILNFQIIGVILSMFGVIIIITKSDFYKLIHLDLNKGDLWLLVAMISWAVYSIMLKSFKSSLSNLSFFQVIVTIGLVFLFPQFLYEYFSGQRINFNIPVMLTISYVVLFAGLGAYLLWNGAISIIGPSKSGVFLHLMPVFTSFMAIFLLNETLMNFHIIGAFIIIFGIYFIFKKKLIKN